MMNFGGRMDLHQFVIALWSINGRLEHEIVHTHEWCVVHASDLNPGSVTFVGTRTDKYGSQVRSG